MGPADDVIRLFETLAAVLERAINVFASDEDAFVDLAALERARDAARRGGSLARNYSKLESLVAINGSKAGSSSLPVC